MTVSNVALNSIAVENLQPHPKNPRAIMRQHVVDGIAADIMAEGFDPSHALIVRPVESHFEIISGHHRFEAAKQCGLTELPCWVRNIEFDPFNELASAVMLTHQYCKQNAATIQASSMAVGIAILDDKFSGEFIAPPKIEWLDQWFPLLHLGDALRLWDIPVDQKTEWEVKPGAQFLRSSDIGFFSKSFNQEKTSQILNLDIPDTPTDPFINTYNGQSCVYFVQAKQLGLIKIGVSVNAPKRLSSLKTGCPDELTLLKIIHGDYAIEKQIHERFSDIRVRGEWFSPTPDLLKFIGEAE